jgi:hypothetical protein
MKRILALIALIAIATGLAAIPANDATAGDKTVVEVAFQNFQWAPPGYPAPGENLWVEDVGNPDEPITKVELFYSEDLKDTATGGSVFDCTVYWHEWASHMKGTFGDAHVITGHQAGYAECSNILGRSGTFEFSSRFNKSPNNGPGEFRMTIARGSGGLEGIKGQVTGPLFAPKLATLGFEPS